MKNSTKVKLALIGLYTVTFYLIPVLLSTMVDQFVDPKKFILHTISYGMGLALGAFIIAKAAEGADDINE